MVESAVVIYAQEIIDYAVGTPASVEFNFEKIWNFKRNRNPFSSLFMNFYHVHPKGMLELSETDINCIKGLYCAFNSPFFFSIVTFDDDDLSNILGRIATFKIDKDKYEKINAHYPSTSQLSFLKNLSYGDINI